MLMSDPPSRHQRSQPRSEWRVPQGAVNPFISNPGAADDPKPQSAACSAGVRRNMDAGNLEVEGDALGLHELEFMRVGDGARADGGGLQPRYGRPSACRTADEGLSATKFA